MLPLSVPPGGANPPESSNTIAKIFVSIRRLRDNPETFHKMCQVTVATIGLASYAFTGISARFTKFVLILQTADMHYFYGFLKLPFMLFYPITADTLNLQQTAENIVLRTGLSLNDALGCINEEVTLMRGGSDINGVYRTSFGHTSEQSFLTSINNRIRVVSAERQLTNEAITNGGIVAYQTRSIAERVNTFLWAFTDITTALFFLDIWKLTDNAKIAASIGQLKGMGWIKNQVLESWIWGSCALAHGINASMSISKYFAATEGSIERTYAKRDTMVSVAEMIFNGTCFVNTLGGRKIPQSALFALAIVAKGSGLWNIVNRWD